MTIETTEFLPQRAARIAGVLYLAIIVLGIWSEAFVRGGLVEPGNAAATASNILASQALFRLGIAADITMGLCDAALAVLLFFLLRPAGIVLASLATVFRLVETAVIAANLVNLQAALLLLRGGKGGSEALGATFIELHGTGYDLALAFFGIACLAYAVLIIRSRLLPRAVGVLVFATGLVYLAGSGLAILAPAAADAFMPAYLLPVVAETAFALWLLAKGVDAERWKQLNA